MWENRCFIRSGRAVKYIIQNLFICVNCSILLNANLYSVCVETFRHRLLCVLCAQSSDPPEVTTSVNWISNDWRLSRSDHWRQKLKGEHNLRVNLPRVKFFFSKASFAARFLVQFINLNNLSFTDFFSICRNNFSREKFASAAILCLSLGAQQNTLPAELRHGGGNNWNENKL